MLFLLEEKKWYCHNTDRCVAVAYYINNCVNEGIMIGTGSCSPYPTVYRASADGMGKGVTYLQDEKKQWTINGSYLGEHANAFNSEIISSGAFQKGIMIESSVKDFGITVSNGKIGIDASSDSNINEYKIYLSVGITYNNGNGSLNVEYTVPVASADSFEAPFVLKAISSVEYDETATTKFANLSEKKTGENGLVYVIVGDTIIIDLSSGNAIGVGKQTSYRIAVINSEGQAVGSVVYINCNGLK